MKKISFVAAMLCCLAITAVAAPVRRVMMTLSPNEEIYWGEYLSNFRTSSYNYICILRNKVTNRQTLVWNGQRKLEAKWITFGHVDVNDFNKCIYFYEKDGHGYIQMESQKYGPYDWVWYNDWYPMQTRSGLSLPQYENKYKFYFDLMGNEYIHDYDGTIYKKSEGRYEYDSPDKKHHLKISEDKRMVTIDGKNYVIPFPVDSDLEKYAPELCLFNDGTCYYVIEHLAYYITPSEVRQINHDVEYFDLDSHTIKPKSVKQSNDKYPNFWSIPLKYEDNKGLFVAYEFLLQDKSKKHTLLAKWNQNYVIVDGNKYGTQCPIDAFYDANTNSFCWIAIENNQMVLYTYAM